MLLRKLLVDLQVYNSALGALARAEAWRGALRLFEELRRDVGGDTYSLCLMISACFLASFRQVLKR